MTKIILNAILAVSLFLSLFFGLNADNVTATVTDTVTTETQVINIDIKNGTRSTVSFCDDFMATSLEQNINGEWVEKGSLGPIPEVALVVYPTFTVTDTVNLLSFGIDHLSVGEYRFVISYSCDGHRTAYAYFNVTE